MTWTYDDPQTVDRDKVRLLIGDTCEDDQLLADEEIAFFIAEHGSVYRAASEAARAIAALFARNVSRSIGGMQADFSAKFRQYRDLADKLRSMDENNPVAPWLSGASKASKEVYESDTDREKITGRKGITDNPWAGTSEYWTDVWEHYR